MVKSQPPAMANRVSAREFDEWSARQISESFERTQRVRELVRNRQMDQKEAIAKAKHMGYLYYIGIMVICGTIIYEWLHESAHDAELRQKNQKKS